MPAMFFVSAWPKRLGNVDYALRRDLPRINAPLSNPFPGIVMKERPLRLIDQMLRAVVAGQKVQMRVPIAGQSEAWKTFTPEWDVNGREFFLVCGEKDTKNLRPILEAVTCPFGQAGDRLWLQEKHTIIPGGDGARGNVVYGSDDPDLPGAKWRSRTQMPRWAARTFIEITHAGIERLHAFIVY